MSAFECWRRDHRWHLLFSSTLATLTAISPAAPLLADEHESCTLSNKSDHPNPSVMEIRLTGDVGTEMAYQLFGEIDQHLTTYPTLKTIKILLSSVGGHVETGFTIHNYLKGLHQRHALQVVTHNVGSVQSAAIDIYCAGNQRITSPYTFFMVHNGHFQLDEGPYDVNEVRKLDEENAITSEAGYALFSACTNLTVTKVGEMFEDQTYIDPDQALELGLTHSIQPATFDRTADIRCQIAVLDDETEK